MQNRANEVTTREGAINLLSLIYNQLQSSAYYDLWRYAWHDTDPSYSNDELTLDPPANVNSIQFGFDPSEPCSIDNCTENTVVRSSHDGRHFCLTHFLQRHSFADINEDDNAISLRAHFDHGISDDEDEEDEFIFQFTPPYQVLPSSTSSTTQNPILEAILGECGCE